ncbi:MAG: 1-acyl-sn-glycerol-3-phosphate acyltransferase [Candidatus Sericytochromatia bacterium]
MQESGIFRQIQEKSKIIEDVINRTYSELLKNNTLDNLILDTAYSEIRRLETYKKTPETKQELSKWKKISQSMLNITEKEKEQTLRDIIAFYAEDVTGNFDPKVYKFATGLLPLLMSVFFRTVSLKSVVIPFPDEKDMDKIVRVSGETDLIKKLSEKGTIILLPTHLSNMDSIVIGWALYRIGLPPFTYGAGKNLFTNPVLSYFMHNLGAYKVDRRLKHNLYKDVLKMYSTVVLERNYNSLFFPGGTRARSGAVETKLKLGLLGTGIKAYINNLINNKENPDIFVVPCTINYHITLEAETLIDDYLRETGKARYIIEDDESSSYPKVLKFLSKTSKMNASLNIKMGSAYDLFGNRVDENGISYDRHNRKVDKISYVMSNGKIEHSEQRDAEYTKELGERITEEFFKNNIPLSTHILAFCLFVNIKKMNPSMDLYRLVKLEPEETVTDVQKIIDMIGRVKEGILELHDKELISIERDFRTKSPSDLLYEAIKIFNTYYEKSLVTEKNNTLISEDLKTIYYYHNRLINYNLEKLI